MAKSKIIASAVAVAIALSSCAGRDPANIQVVQPTDQWADCTAITAESNAINMRLSNLSSEQGEKVAQNVAAGVAGLFIWPLWFAMDFKGGASADMVALQSRQQYLAALAAQRCNGNAVPRVAAAAPVAR